MKKNKLILAAIPIVTFFILWEIAARMKWINLVLFPAPTEIIIAVVALYKKGLPVRSELAAHIFATLKRLGVGYIAGTFLGILIGIMMGVSNRIYRLVNPLISVLMPIPGIALAPLFIIWFGFGNPTVITLGALSTFFPIVYSTAAGVRSVNHQLVRAAKIMGASPLQVIANVHLPWAAAYVISGMKIGLARGWMTIIAVEFVAASNYGLGYMIWKASEFLQAKIVFGGIFIMVIIFFILDKGIIRTLENKTIANWGMLSKK